MAKTKNQSEALCRAIGDVCKRRRITMGDTLPRIAKSARISKGELSKIENGKANLTIETLCRLAKALYASPHEILQSASISVDYTEEHPSGLSGEHDVVLDAIQAECLGGN